MSRHSSVISLSLDVKKAIMFAPKLLERVAHEIAVHHGLHVVALPKSLTLLVTMGVNSYWVESFEFLKPLSLEQDILTLPR